MPIFKVKLKPENSCDSYNNGVIIEGRKRDQEKVGWGRGRKTFVNRKVLYVRKDGDNCHSYTLRFYQKKN